MAKYGFDMIRFIYATLIACLIFSDVKAQNSTNTNINGTTGNGTEGIGPIVGSAALIIAAKVSPNPNSEHGEHTGTGTGEHAERGEHKNGSMMMSHGQTGEPAVGTGAPLGVSNAAPSNQNQSPMPSQGSNSSSAAAGAGAGAAGTDKAAPVIVAANSSKGPPAPGVTSGNNNKLPTSDCLGCGVTFVPDKKDKFKSDAWTNAGFNIAALIVPLLVMGIF